MASGVGPLKVAVLDLMRRPGSQRHVATTVHLEGLVVGDSLILPSSPIDVSVTCESQSNSITVLGSLTAPWAATCRRCLVPVAQVLTIQVDEVFDKRSEDGDSYPLEIDFIDLEPMVRDLILLELPIAPVCREDCAGLCPDCGINRNDATCACDAKLAPGPWDALDGLKLSDE